MYITKEYIVSYLENSSRYFDASQGTWGYFFIDTKRLIRNSTLRKISIFLIYRSLLWEVNIIYNIRFRSTAIRTHRKPSGRIRSRSGTEILNNHK